MKFGIKLSTFIIFLICQIIISLGFYLDDKFVSSGEAVFTFLLSIPLTMFIQWIREINKLPEENND